MIRKEHYLDRAGRLRAALEVLDDPLARQVLAAAIGALEEGAEEEQHFAGQKPSRPVSGAKAD